MNHLFCFLMKLVVVNIVEDLDDLPFCLVSRMRSLDVDLPTTTLLLFRADPCSNLNKSAFSYQMQWQVGSLEQEVASSELTQQHGR